MMLQLFRLTFTANSTQGLLSVDGMSKFTTLEPAKGSGMLIDPGVYHVIKQFSPRFQKLTPHLQNVPGHTFIEMHSGNAPKDTHGCILLGLTRAPDWVGESFDAFNAFMGITPNEFDLQIAVTEETT